MSQHTPGSKRTQPEVRYSRPVVARAGYGKKDRCFYVRRVKREYGFAATPQYLHSDGTWRYQAIPVETGWYKSRVAAWCAIFKSWLKGGAS